MVIFDLICDSQHEFEGWFKNSDELVSQQKNGMLICPVCESGEVHKKIAAPKLGKKSNASTVAPKNSVSNPESIVAGGGSKQAYAQLQKMLGKVHDFIDTNFEDVGNKFTDQALSMHKGEIEASNIRGTANQDQLKKLAKEGVTALPLPVKPVDKKKLN